MRVYMPCAMLRHAEPYHERSTAKTSSEQTTEMTTTAAMTGPRQAGSHWSCHTYMCHCEQYTPHATASNTPHMPLQAIQPTCHCKQYTPHATATLHRMCHCDSNTPHMAYVGAEGMQPCIVIARVRTCTTHTSNTAEHGWHRHAHTQPFNTACVSLCRGRRVRVCVCVCLRGQYRLIGSQAGRLVGKVCVCVCVCV